MAVTHRFVIAILLLYCSTGFSLSLAEKRNLAEDIFRNSSKGTGDPQFHAAIGRVYRATESSPVDRATVLDLAADRIPVHKSKEYAAVAKYLQGYALGLWEGRVGSIKTEDYAQSESLRRGHFLTDDQAEWNRRSNLAIEHIRQMLREKNSLFEIYEYARKERHKIAIAQKTVGAIEFGEVREGFGRDFYQRGLLSGADADTSIYEIIVSLLLSQREEFSRIKMTELFLSDDDGYYKPEAGKLEVYQYTYAPESSDGFDITFLIEHDLQNGQDKEPRSVRVRWPMMGEHLYAKHLADLGVDVSNIMKKKVRGEAALYEIGLVVHALCQTIFLKRGSAAVNGWIMKALCKEKEYSVANLRIEGLPFDIYAQFQVDKVKFANAFVKAVLAAQKSAS